MEKAATMNVKEAERRLLAVSEQGRALCACYKGGPTGGE